MNNHGWGLKEMLFFSALIFCFLILVVILINNLYSGLNVEKESSNSYSQIEKNLELASEKYYRKYKEEIGNIILSSDLIESGYLKEEKLQTEDDVCEGYVLIEDEFKAYITCENYETEGY